MAQTSYTNDMPRARAGMVAYPMRTARVQTYAAEGFVPFGYALVKGTTKEQAKVAAAASDKFVGFAQMTLAINETSNVGSSGYPAKDAVNVLEFGEIWVPYSGTAPTTENKVYVDVLVSPGKVTATATNNMDVGLKCKDVDTGTGLCLVEIQTQN